MNKAVLGLHCLDPKWNLGSCEDREVPKLNPTEGFATKAEAKLFAVKTALRAAAWIAEENFTILGYTLYLQQSKYKIKMHNFLD